MQINLNNFSISFFESIISKREQKCILYCDFNVANLIYEQKLSIPEGFVLYPDSNLMHFVIKLLGKSKVKKTVSTDLQEQIINICDEKKLKLFLFGDEEAILESVIKNLKQYHHGISVVGHQNGYNYDNSELIQKIKTLNPDILLLGLGAGRQEKWLINNFTFLPSLVVISVGGYFKFLSGLKKRAPFLFRKLNLEWFFRVITEFRYVWKKYSYSAIKFLYRIMTNKIKFTFIADEEL